MPATDAEEASDVPESVPRLVCPQCLRWIPLVNNQCVHCGHDLQWLRARSRLMAIISRPLKREDGFTLEVQLQIHSSHVHQEVRFVPGESRRLRTESGQDMQINVSEEGTELTLQVNEERHRVQLPGKLELPHCVLQAQTQVVLHHTPEPPALKFHSGEIPLKKSSGYVSLGRKAAPGDQSHHALSDERIDFEHALIVRQDTDSQPQYWIADCQSEGYTFVNGKPVFVQKLEPYDLVQLGPYGWTFHLTDGYLNPVKPITGLSLSVRSLESRFLSINNLEIPAGQLVAIVGKSGSGKSSFLKAILGLPRNVQRERRHILANGYDIHQHRQWFCSRVGYVSQGPILHERLTARQILEFAAKLRGQAFDESRINGVLRSVDLSKEDGSKTPRQLSGGEGNRVRTAVELVLEPGLLLMDEPTSGLDPHRSETLLKLLRTLKLRGCTILVITHTTQQLSDSDIFDRVLVIGKNSASKRGEIQFDGTPAALREMLGWQPGMELDLDRLQAPQSPIAELEASGPPAGGEPPPLVKRSLWRQFGTLLHRECHLILSDKLWRLLLPCCFVPILFAVAFSMAVPAHNLSLLGFLSILAVIWMGSSLALPSIVNERAVIDHEQALFLSARSYTGMKMFSLCVISAMQVTIFLLSLYWIRRWQYGFDDQGNVLHMLQGCFHVAGPLLMAGWTSVALGLAISAVVGESKESATFSLPLVMMFQIVFSALIASKGEGNLREAYGEFPRHVCRFAEVCGKSADRWVPERMGWICQNCYQEMHRKLNESHPEDFNGEVLIETLQTRDPADSDAVKGTEDHVGNLAGWLSYLTISRHADVALRTFAYGSSRKQDSIENAHQELRERYNAESRFTYDWWYWSAMGSLATFLLILVCSSALFVRFRMR